MSAFATAFHDLILGPSLARHHQEWLASLPDDCLRTDCCPDCGGDGGFEVTTGVDYRDGSPLGYIAECTTCCGKGEATFPVFPIDEFDLPTKASHYRYFEKDPSTTHADIMALFDRAIQAAS